MKKSLALALLCTVALSAVGCRTSTTVRTAPGSQLYVYDRPVTPDARGRVVTRPFGWGATAGVPYRLEQNGTVIQQGTMRSQFRPASLFWPPLALIYWPLGFHSGMAYDLTQPAPPPQQAK